MSNKIFLLDGAIGTSLWDRTGETDPVWTFNITHPDVVLGLAKEYIEAGSDIILTNTFGANRPSVERSSSFSVADVMSSGVRIAKEAAAHAGAKVALSVGPLTQMMEPFGDLEEEEVAEIYNEQIGAGMQEKPDIILLETFMDVEMMRVAAETAKTFGVPVFCTMTFEAAGRTLFGNSVQDVIDTLSPLGIDAIGMNCSLGPDQAIPIIKEFSEKTNIPLVFKPNAGKPVMSADGKTEIPYSADSFAKEIAPALDFVSYIGGCCGTGVEYIKEIKKLLN